MKSLRTMQIAVATAVLGLSLCGCNQQGETPSASPATQEPTAQSTPQMTAPTPTNNPPAPTLTPPPLPEATMPTSTNELPMATPLPSMQQ
jgi:uncharacterized lipoprotein